MPRTVRLALLLGLAVWVSAARAEDELARLGAAAQPQTGHRGLHSDFSDDDPIGRFMDLLAEGAIGDARSLQPQVCAAWTRGRAASPWSGRFYVSGVEISLNRLCGLDERTPR